MRTSLEVQELLGFRHAAPNLDFLSGRSCNLVSNLFLTCFKIMDMFGPVGGEVATIRNTLSAAGNSMSSSERPSPEPLLKKEASPAVLVGENSGVMLWRLQTP